MVLRIPPRQRNMGLIKVYIKLVRLSGRSLVHCCCSHDKNNMNAPVNWVYFAFHSNDNVKMWKKNFHGWEDRQDYIIIRLQPFRNKMRMHQFLVGILKPKKLLILGHHWIFQEQDK